GSLRSIATSGSPSDRNDIDRDPEDPSICASVTTKAHGPSKRGPPWACQTPRRRSWRQTLLDWMRVAGTYLVSSARPLRRTTSAQPRCENTSAHPKRALSISTLARPTSTPPSILGGRRGGATIRGESADQRAEDGTNYRSRGGTYLRRTPRSRT